ncbi:hypothetical protein BDZ94DRAFT_1199681 [Collybia nuda]|uniref:Peptidase S9 prolyl oligopeptidase catalytic domain-containing protein n=1 Tax=Collybia nuda TaxID=64659 RepID=A0A9P5XZ04_9AGAR|nr:hypothetical protein BDZ94DRAFT_1199681 [Collybia nuda]
MTMQSTVSTIDARWKLDLSTSWDVLGPFPIHAREQQYISPSFPINLSEPIDLNRSWPSSYADGGRVKWTTMHSHTNGDLEVAFPNIRWKSLRSTEGWAALQHHAVLRTTLTVYPPKDPDPQEVPHLLVNLVQGSYITVIPAGSVERARYLPEWHAGNIYNLERSLPRAINLPSPPSLIHPTTYNVIVSGDYEIRLFGDPNIQGTDIPVQRITLTIALETPFITPVLEPSQDVVCDFVDGWAFGNALGVGIRSISHWWTVESISTDNAKGIQLTLQHQSRLAPTQTRIIPILLSQDRTYEEPKIPIRLTLTSKDRTITVSTFLTIRHLSGWSASTYDTIKATYFFGISTPTAFKVIPPIYQSPNFTVPILALHGAGVDIIDMPFWSDSLARNKHSWIIIPTGRTSWGLDWHGPSATDAWSTIDSLFHILAHRGNWNMWKIAKNSRAVIMGHSNGGQGAWYLASRYPDKAIGVIPAAGYIKSQSYVPLTMSRSAHFIDPALRAILEASLTPDDNDLYLSNLVDTPILAIHGGDDENVPVWHTREASGIIQAYSKDADLVLREDPRQGHWYHTILNNVQVDEFLDRVLDSPEGRMSKHFTLTILVPGEAGSLHGWMINSLAVPGRLGRLHISINVTGIRVITSNVHAFSVDTRLNECTSLHIDNSMISFPPIFDDTLYFEDTGAQTWQVGMLLVIIRNEGDHEGQPPCRLQQILASSGPLVFIIPDLKPSRELTIASRIVHDLQLYHRLDAEIFAESEASSILEGPSWHHSNIIFIGSPSSDLASNILGKRKTSFGIKDSRLILDGRALGEMDEAALFLHPHPAHTADKIMLFILSAGHDPYALERAARLFPIRTGVVGTSWLLVGRYAESIGAAGITGAGIWGRDWTFDRASSWLI